MSEQKLNEVQHDSKEREIVSELDRLKAENARLTALMFKSATAGTRKEKFAADAEIAEYLETLPKTTLARLRAALEAKP